LDPNTAARHSSHRQASIQNSKRGRISLPIADAVKMSFPASRAILAHDWYFALFNPVTRVLIAVRPTFREDDFTGLGNIQKHIMWKQSLTLRMTPLKRIEVFAFSALVLTVGLLEFGHLVRYGHFPPFGLHADVVVREADYGIDGVTKVYEAKLTNYGVTPGMITACDFINDAMSHGIQVGYTVEKWDPSTQKWESIFTDDKSGFCHPYPLGMVETHVITKRLWPGQSISAGEEATAARGVFAVGDKARFVVFAGDGLTFPTPAFPIEQHPSMPNIPYRVRY
jgi:hypothetical protein